MSATVKHTFQTGRRVISASRRTDIPAFYSEWFMRRVRDGVVAVPNPMNAGQVSWVSLEPEYVDAIVFWTKNAAPLLPHVPDLERSYKFYFQYTVTAYPEWLERKTPSIEQSVDTFRRLSELVGAQRVVWRYDPILFLPGINAEWQLEHFHVLAESLDGYTERCVISFIDVFRKAASNLKKALSSVGVGGQLEQSLRDVPEDLHDFARRLREAACGIPLTTCAEPSDINRAMAPHVMPGKCVDDGLLRALGAQVQPKKDKGQREACGCVESREIGMYDSCRHGCAFCYATVSEAVGRASQWKHYPDSASLLGRIDPAECPGRSRQLGMRV
jgi:hypothetical protein